MAPQRAEASLRPGGGLHPIAEAARAEGLAPQWRALASAPLAPSGAGLSSWIIPQLRHLGAQGLLALPVFENGAMTGLFALCRQTRRWGLGWPVLATWSTPLTFSGLPLLADQGGQGAFAQLLHGMDAAALLLQSVPADGPFWDCLSKAAAETGAHVHVCETWERAALMPAGSYADWFDGNFERKRRKEYRRLRARLAEAGRLESLAWEPSCELQSWIDGLISLEARGWKGRRGTALASQPAATACLSEALHGLARDGCLRFWRLVLDGRAIASLFAVVHAPQAWLGKIAYDETYAKFSPGVLLILDATESLMNDPSIRLADSCAIPGHPLIDNMWRDRLRMADVMISAPGTSVARVKAMVGAETLRRRARAAAKHAWHAIAGGRRS